VAAGPNRAPLQRRLDIPSGFHTTDCAIASNVSQLVNAIWIFPKPARGAS